MDGSTGVTLVAATVMTILLGGCVQSTPQPHVLEGEREHWQGAIFQEPIVVDRGAELNSTGLLETPGPIIVRGTWFGQSLNIRFTGRPEDAAILVDGGAVMLERSGFSTPISIEVRNDAHVSMNNATVSATALAVRNGGLFTGEKLTLFAASPGLEVVVVENGRFILSNSSADGIAFRAERDASIRLVNVGVGITSFRGVGVIERTWHARIAAKGDSGAPLPNARVNVHSVGVSAEFGFVETSENGEAYVELVEIRRRNGEVEAVTPHTFDLDDPLSKTLAYVNSEDQLIVVRQSAGATQRILRLP
ncbi:MAG TPA: hypothetical protein VM370_02265 [Candidatus Thermoplasmatota archaeon]|nr:hypothetical protein [Candidatus Thermoplasmatota archaeon]